MNDRETAYEHEAGEDCFYVTAGERWSINMIRRLKEKYPDEIEVMNENLDGSLIAKVPARWMRIRPVRKVTLSEEQKAELRKRLSGCQISKEQE